MAKQTVHLQLNEEVAITLPDGRVVSVRLSCLEPGEQLSEQRHEIDIKFDEDLLMNFFGKKFVTAKPTKYGAHVLKCRRVIVPLPART